MRKLVVALTALGLLALLAPRALAATTVVVTIKADPNPTKVKLSPDPAGLTEGDKIAFQNDGTAAYEVCITDTNDQLVFVEKGKKAEYPYPIGGGLDYYVTSSGCAANAPRLAQGRINVKPAPVTTTTAAPTTTVAPTTTAPTTTSTSTTRPTTTTTSTSTTTTSTTVPVPVTVSASGKGGGGSGTALLLGAAAAVVAGLAAAAFVAYRRSQQPYDDDPDGWDDHGGWTGGPPPTQAGPAV